MCDRRVRRLPLVLACVFAGRRNESRRLACDLVARYPPKASFWTFYVLGQIELLVPVWDEEAARQVMREMSDSVRRQDFAASDFGLTGQSQW